MAVATNQYLHFNVKAEMYLQECNFGVDYRLMTGNDVPIAEINSDLKSWYDSWILGWLHPDYHVVEYRTSVYSHLSNPQTNAQGLPRLKIWYGEQHAITGLAGDVGGGGSTPLPTFVTASAAKKFSGLPTRFNMDGTYTNNQLPDTPFRGKISTSGVTEDMTQNAQGNKLAVATGANWLTTWNNAFGKFVNPEFREGNVGQLYSLRMQIKSERGPNGIVRQDDNGDATNPVYIMFRPVGSVVANEFVGSQLTRKQRKKFQ